MTIPFENNLSKKEQSHKIIQWHDGAIHTRWWVTWVPQPLQNQCLKWLNKFSNPTGVVHHGFAPILEVWVRISQIGQLIGDESLRDGRV